MSFNWPTLTHLDANYAEGVDFNQDAIQSKTAV